MAELQLNLPTSSPIARRRPRTQDALSRDLLPRMIPDHVLNRIAEDDQNLRGGFYGLGFRV